MVGNYEGSGITQYGGNLYYLNESVKLWDWRFHRSCMFLIAGIVLLVLSLILRKSLGTAVGQLAKILGKIPLVLKIVVFLILVAFTIPSGGDAFGQIDWYVRDRLFLDSDGIYLLKQLTMAGNCLAIWFWLAFAAVLDGRANVKRQRQEMLERRQMRELKYPVQKRLVQRERKRLFADGGVILVATAVVLAAYLMWREYIEKYYDYWEWYEDGRIFGFRGLAGLVVMAAFAVFGALLLFVGSDLWRLRKSRRLAEDIGALSDRIGAVREGKLTDDLRLPEDSDLREAAENLNEIRIGLETALAEQIKSERMKVDLVTNVSHDIKTPLTSIISYVELLRQEQDLPQHVKEYIQILGEKSERLRSIVQDVFEVSKATSGQLPIQTEILDMGKLLRQTLADMNGQIEESSLIMRTAIPQTPVFVQADGQRLYRVFQNLIQNALRYSLAGSRIYLTLEAREEKAVVQIKNTSSVELADNKDFTERFVRGDDSRTDGGSGLGLSIARSFTEACGGSFLVETNADLFTVTVSFPESSKEMTVQKETVEEAVEERQDILE
ncbi:MAG: HAMP domain-containing histidine kinase [Lachnospiraceae bacterium]|nr:HAMP domain-containing histidine kinase [Lachnospiraceae bacterium]